MHLETSVIALAIGLAAAAIAASNGLAVDKAQQDRGQSEPMPPRLPDFKDFKRS